MELMQQQQRRGLKKEKSQALQVACSMKGRNDKGKRKVEDMNTIVNSTDLSQEGSGDEDIYITTCDDGVNENNGMVRKAQKTNKPISISKRQEALDTSFQAALVAYEQERIHKRNLLQKLETIATQMKKTTEKALEEQSRVLRAVLEVQHHLSNQIIQLMNEIRH